MRQNRIRIDQQATYNTLAKLMLGRRVSLAISLFAYLPLQFPRCPVSKQSTHPPITITIMSSPSSLLFLFFFHSSSHYTLHTTTLTHITIYIHNTHSGPFPPYLAHLHTACLLGYHRSTSCTFPITTTRLPRTGVRTCEIIIKAGSEQQ